MLVQNIWWIIIVKVIEVDDNKKKMIDYAEKEHWVDNN
jgi:hypothetical protein